MQRLWTPQGGCGAVRTGRVMAVLRGRGLGLEVALDGRDFEEALAELQGKLGERPGFYSGTPATAALGSSFVSDDQLVRLRTVLREHGIALHALSGDLHVQPFAAAQGLQYVPAVDDGGEELARRRALRPKRDIRLSDAARSLVADFAGARSDIAARRRRGETSVPPVLIPAPEAATVSAQLELPATVSTLYHSGTLRGGQAVHHIGNAVIVGDVNPGAEVVASGDIAVFGALRGVAHAGAQGDMSARVYALVLAPTQLRIATLIAADPGDRPDIPIPEAACVQNDRITIVPLDRAESFSRENTQ